MSSYRLPAVTWCLATVVGIELGRQAFWCPPSLTLPLSALGVMWRGAMGSSVCWLGLGLTLGALRGEPALWPEPDRPVVLIARPTGHWRVDQRELSVMARAQWLRQGTQVTRWRRKVVLVLPVRSEPPRALGLRVTGYLRRAPAPANGLQGRPGSWVLRTKSWSFVRERRAPVLLELWHRASGGIRRLVADRLEQAEGARDGPGWHVTRALVLGQGAELPAAWRRGLRSAGLSHLVALSGLHVGLLTGIGLLLGSAAPRWGRFTLPALLLGTYLLLAGLRPSLLRATLMLAAVAGARCVGRAPQAVNSLSWVTLSMVLASPDLVRDVGFQLSVSATAGLVVLGPRLQERWPRVPEGLRRSLSFSVGAQLGALPWTLSNFHLLTPLSPLWNLLAVPWTAMTLMVALLWVLLLLVAPPAAEGFRALVDLFGLPFGMFAELGPELSWPVAAHLGWWSSLLVAGLLISAFLCRRLVPIVGLLALGGLLIFRSEGPAGVPEITLLDVGQGEAILLRDGTRSALVDGGGWRRADIGQRILLPALSRLGVRRLDAIVLTHPDRDHCGGLLDVTSYLSVRRLYTAPGWRSGVCARQLVLRPGLEVRALWRGEVAELGRWRLTALHPPAGDRREGNNRSLVLLAEAEGHRALLTGDVESIGERELLKELGETLPAIEILKVAHHGSDTSTTAAWLARIRPRLALISCGVGNRYGHPSARVLERLAQQGVPTLRTDLHGSVRVLLAPRQPLRVQLPGGPRERLP